MAQRQIFKDINQLLSLKGVVRKQGRGVTAEDLSIVKNAALVVENGKLLWMGKASQLPARFDGFKVKSLKHKNVFPGFVDCHTHMIFAGDRKNEFELRNQGVSYQEIAKQGGGILSTMKATRRASLSELVELAMIREQNFLKQGVTTVEIKSGYGLNKKTEEKMLKAAQSLKKISVVPTYLGAHAIPKEFSSEEEYIEQLKKDLLSIKKQSLANRVDIFVEKNYFSISGARDYLSFAKEHGFDITIHADQLSRSQATGLAIEMGARSADHVICLNKKDKVKLASSQTAAVLLPCADFYLQCDYPDARGLIDQGGLVALASDFNPGSSPTQNISLLGILARLEMKMSLPEVFSALTVGGAYALGLEKECGALLPGFRGDFFTSSQQWQDFFYDMSAVPVIETYRGGKKV